MRTQPRGALAAHSLRGQIPNLEFRAPARAIHSIPATMPRCRILLAFVALAAVSGALARASGQAGLAGRGPVQVGAASDRGRHHRQRPAHASLPVCRRLDAGPPHRRARATTKARRTSRASSSAWPQARRRQRHATSRTLPYGPIGFDSATSRARRRRRRRSTPKPTGFPSRPRRRTASAAASTSNASRRCSRGRWGDTVALDPARVQGQSRGVPRHACQRGARGGRGGGGDDAVLRCDSVVRTSSAPKQRRSSKRRIARADSADSAAGRARRARGGAPRARRRRTRHARASAGAVGILLIALDQASPHSGARGVRRARRDAARPAQAAGPGAAAITSAAAQQLFGKPLDQLAVGTTGKPVTAHWSYDWHMSATPARNVIAILPGSDPARAERVRARQRAQRSRRRQRHRRRSRLAARREHGHAAAGRQRSRLPPDARRSSTRSTRSSRARAAFVRRAATRS